MKGVAAMILAMALNFFGISGMTNTEMRIITGGAIGVGNGALIGVAMGSVAFCAATGGVLGVAGGYFYDHYEKSRRRS